MGRTVSSPDGNRWYVRRVWLPWTPRWRKPQQMPDVSGLDVASGCGDEILAGIGIVLFVLVAFVVFVVFVGPTLLFLLEALVVLLLAALGGVARVALRRPWIVEATPATGPGVLRWKVVGWRRSGEVVDEVATQLAAGRRRFVLRDAFPESPERRW